MATGNRIFGRIFSHPVPGTAYKHYVPDVRPRICPALWSGRLRAWIMFVHFFRENHQKISLKFYWVIFDVFLLWFCQ